MSRHPWWSQYVKRSTDDVSSSTVTTTTTTTTTTTPRPTTTTTTTTSTTTTTTTPPPTTQTTPAGYDAAPRNDKTMQLSHRSPTSTAVSFTVNNDLCEDRISKIAGSMSCPDFLQRYGYQYCQQAYIKKNCCASQQRYCTN